MFDYGIARRLVPDIPSRYGNARIVSRKDEYRVVVSSIPVEHSKMVSFFQDRMDFNPYREDYRSSRNVLNFAKIPLDCREMVKVYCLNLLDGGMKPTTVCGHLQVLSQVINASIKASGSGSFSGVTTRDIIDAVEKDLWPESIVSPENAYRTLVNFFSYLHDETDYLITVDLEMIFRRSRFYSDLRSGYDGRKHSPLIPPAMLDSFIDRFDEVMRNEEAPYDDRVLAGVLLANTQLGLRVSEIPALRKNCLHSIMNVDGTVDDYIVYNCIKVAKAQQESIRTKTICTPLAKDTINYLLRLRTSIPGLEGNKFLYARNTESCRAGRVEDLEDFRRAYKYFCVKYLSDVVTKNWNGIRQVKVNGGRYCIPGIHSFRVTFATSLLQQGMDPDYIDCILGHSPMSDCLDAYIYPKSRRKIDKCPPFNVIIN